jgi:hypothetical protein
MPWLKQHSGLIGATCVFLIFFALAVAGGIRTFSPVPYWDMWGGTLGFFIAHSDGDSSIWWSLHNEHRIVLSRVLFWIDYKFFGGTSIFLIVMNYILVLSAIAVFYRISLARLESEPQAKTLSLIITGLIGAWLFQWMQEENLSWAFQSQIFLAQLLPLLALYVLFQSIQKRSVESNGDKSGRGTGDSSGLKSISWFFSACLLGIASAGTMANGVIALPLMAIYVLIMRQPWWQSSVLAVLSIITITLYFSDYNPPASHGSLTETLLSQPLKAIQYVLLYLGTPFYLLLGQNESSQIVALLASCMMGLISVIALLQYVRYPQHHGLPLALVFYIIFLAGTALGTAGGRLVFGVEQALTFRYTTPALMAWASLFVLSLPGIISAFQRWRIASTSVLMALLLTMLSLQLNALEPKHQQIFDRAVAALTLELGVRDESRILTTYVMSDGLIGTAEVASAYNLSVFGIYPWRDLRAQLGRRFTDLPAEQCLGHLDIVHTIDQENNFLQIDGWIFDSNTHKSPQRIRIISSDAVTIGFALSGRPRPDVAKAVNSKAGLSGFSGYISSPIRGAELRLVGDNPGCVLNVDLPAIPSMDGDS